MDDCRRLARLCLPIVVVFSLAAGCGSKSDAPSEDPASPAEPSAKADAREQPRDGATLSGVVLFDGDPIPEETMIPIQTDPEYCARHGKDGVYPSEDCLIDAESRGVRNVIVYLMGDTLRNWPGAERQDIVVDNRNCRFEPHVNVSTVGSAVEVRNSDEVYHTTHLYGPPGFVEFNPGMRRKGDAEKTTLTRPGLYLVKCDRHGWMNSVVRVDPHPFHAVTDEQGRFEIRGIPPGKYRLGMFHERFRTDTNDPQAVDIDIGPDGKASVELKLSQ